MRYRKTLLHALEMRDYFLQMTLRIGLGQYRDDRPLTRHYIVDPQSPASAPSPAIRERCIVVMVG